jgi:hypothetical protein
VVKEKPVQKNYIFRTISIYLSGVSMILNVLIGQKPRWEAAAVVIKLLWKPISDT